LKIGGVMSGLGQRVIGGTTEKTVNDVFAYVKKQLET